MGTTDPFKTQPPDPNATRPPAVDDIRMMTAGARMAPNPPIPDFHPDCRADDTVGDYRLVRRLGAGGFGTVFLAERVQPFAKEVALKVVNAAHATDPVALARFEMERRLLAQLDHPNIATLLDGGNSVSGQMFLVMEFVKGVPIMQHCDEQRVSIRGRLELFMQLLDAIQYAHAKNVIHRDLSPRNVLVERDGSGAARVKVIDFGLAKSFGPTLEPGRNVTGEDYLPGTLGYASPEQFEPGAPGVDTRSDIYSLGAILYELLAGAPPFDPDDLRAQGRAMLHRVLRERTPRTPSDMLSTMATSDTATAERIASARQERLDRLAGTLREDLQYIPLQALRPEQRDRYQTVQAMALDVRAYLDDGPVRAAPPSWRYRARKFVSRHRGAVAVAALLLAALIGTTVAVSLSLVQRDRALAQAEDRERDLLATVDFMGKRMGDLENASEAGELLATEIARQADGMLRLDGLPDGERQRRLVELAALLKRLDNAEIGKAVLDRLVLQPAEARALADFRALPDVRGSLLMSIGPGRWALGTQTAGEDAYRLVSAAHASFLEAGRPDDPRVRWAETWQALVDPDEKRGLELARRLADERRGRLGPDAPDTLEAMRVLRDRLGLDAGGLSQAVALGRDIARATRADASPQAIEDRIKLGWLLIDEQRDEAIPMLEECVASLPIPGSSRDLAIIARTSLGRVLASDQASPERRARGLALLEECVSLAEGLWGERHAMAFRARSDLSGCLVLSQELDPARRALAERMFERNRTLAAGMSTLPAEVLVDRGNEAALRERDGDAPGAVSARRDAFRLLRERFPAEDVSLLQAQRALADSEAKTGNFAEALRLLREAARVRRASGEPDSSVEMLALAFSEASALRGAGNPPGAVAVLRAAQAAAKGDPERGPGSASRWLVSSMLLGMLQETGADPREVAVQQSEVEQLRPATRDDWRKYQFADAPVNP